MPAAALAARLSAANAEADDASPAPAGKLFSLSTRAKWIKPARLRTRSSRELTRRNPAPLTGRVLMNNSSWLRAGSKCTRVRVSKPARFIEMEALAGIRSLESRSPQYLIKAIFALANAVAVPWGLSGIRDIKPLVSFQRQSFHEYQAGHLLVILIQVQRRGITI
jgi:hypothetical protein